MTGIEDTDWSRLYRELEKPLYNVVFRWLWDVESSQDIVQEAFLRCWRKRAYVEQDGFKALVFRTALNLAKNEQRRKRLWQFVTLWPVEQPENQQAIEADFLRKPLRQAVDALPEQLKTVLMLSEMAGLSYREIAEVTGVKEGTVGSRRHRALTELQEELKARGVVWSDE